MKSTLAPLLFLLMAYSSFATDADSLAMPGKIKIMTWNVKFLPRGATFLDHHPVKRAKIIPAKLQEIDPDIIVLQEAYDGKSIRIMKRSLKATHPYLMGHKNRKLITYKRAGGVLMFCKYPMKELQSIKYKNCDGFIDCNAAKGALLVDVQHPRKRFQVLGTHMQAGGGRDLKNTQYAEAGALLKQYETPEVPQFATGDFNTKQNDTILYPMLLKALDAEDGEIHSELKFTSDHLLNDMDSYDPNKRRLIDYVFLRHNGAQLRNTTRQVLQLEHRWHKRHKSLSDHNPVLLETEL